MPPTAPSPSQRPPEPLSPQAILTHLEQVLASKTFSGARRQQRLLRYLVEKTVAGIGESLKEYSLGLEVFDRGQDFDPRLDPIVRVEASRLRSRLQKYYDSEEVASPVRIQLPRGGYLPLFSAPDAAPAAPEAGEALPEPAPAAVPLTGALDRKAIGIVLVLLICASAIGAAGFWWMARSGASRAAYSRYTRLTGEQIRCTSPSLSPDGKSLAYSARTESGWHLYVRRIRGVDARQLNTGADAVDRQPAYSPDGRRIAFRSERDGGGLFVVDEAGGAARRVSRFGFHPAWSPDGRQIAFSSETFNEPGEDSPERRSAIFITDLSTGTLRQLTGAETVYDAVQPAWSPNGERVAYWGADREGRINLYTISAVEEKPEPVAVTQDPWTEWSPAWSPDGRYLYFSSDRSGAMNLWRVNIDESTGVVRGQEEPLTTPSSNSGWVTFSRDGAEFAYVRRLMFSRLYSADFDAASGQITSTPKELTSGERRVREPAVSPDGNWLAVRIQDPQEDIAVMHPDGTGLRRITNDAYTDRMPIWIGPDTLRFYSNRGGRFGVWSIRRDGTNLQPLSEGNALLDALVSPVAQPSGALDGPNLVLPQTSPSGAYVSGWLSASSPAQRSYVILPVAGGERWELGLRVATPTWLKHNNAMLVFQDNEIRFADVRKRELTRVYSRAGADIHGKFVLSNDERTLFFVVMEDEEDVWIAEP
jgi:Tol biopolymer transport system component